MANIRVDVDYTIKDGTEIVFRSPVDCTDVTGLTVCYLKEGGGSASSVFAFADAHGNNVGDIPHLFAKNGVVKVILDVTSGMAFVQNADTNAYLEGRFEELLPKTELNTAINKALAQAKDSGEFQGETPVRGEDYWTAADQAKIANDISQEITAQVKSLEALPQGGSSAWLEANGDPDQLYQIDGYVWGYVEGTGWTKSGTRFRVVSSTGAMSKEDGLPYLLRNGSVGEVYAFHEASGDANTPVYDSLPETAVDGEIVAVGGKKYKASLETVHVEHNAYDPDTVLFNYRINTSGEVVKLNGALLTDFIPVERSANCPVTIKGIDRLYSNYGSYIMVDYFDASKTRLGAASSGYWTALHSNKWDGTLPKTFNLFGYTNHTVDGIENTAYVRLKLGITDETAIEEADCEGLVINFSDKDTIKTVVKWVEAGTYLPPVAAGWKATGETRDIIDNITSAGSNGQTAVYSIDGYVYTYIDGGTWMGLSKYQSPAGRVDKDLSFESENPLENKVITAKFDEVETGLRNNTLQLRELSQRVADLSTGGGTTEVPAEWKTAVKECIAKIKALQMGRNCVTFPFFSDNHQRNGYAGLLIAHIMKECNIPYCFFGGDSISSGTIADEAEMIAQDKAFDASMAYVPNGRVCRAVGNHDGYWTDGTNKFFYDRNGIYDLFLREESIAQNKHFGEDGTYYYVDDIASKVRFVVLNTNGLRNASGGVVGSTFDSTQLAWLQNTALNTESGWAVVLICHQPLSNHYHALINNASEVIAAIRASNADVVGCFSGHIHRDRIYTGIAVNTSDDSIGAALPFTQVTITSDYTTIAYDDATKHTVGSDDKSHAIDFVTINKGTRTVNITRLGIGSDRSYTY